MATTLTHPTLASTYTLHPSAGKRRAFLIRDTDGRLIARTRLVTGGAQPNWVTTDAAHRFIGTMFATYPVETAAIVALGARERTLARR